MKLHMNLNEKSYDIYLEKGILNKVKDYVNLNRKVMIITDDLVPTEYSDILSAQCNEAFVEVVEHGEGAKSFKVFEHLCKALLDHGFHRKDLIIALGGGVIGDLSGYVAASFMRGIDFVNIPTTTLSQIDSSIGGKVAINLNEVKNIIGAFYQPKAVFIDPLTLNSLPDRHFYNGLVEALKAGLIYDKTILDLFETDNIKDQLETIIYKSLCVKKDVVEKDEKEMGLRKILNFGHTIGHGIETYYHLSEVYHGEAVALGMLPMIEDETLKERVISILKKMNIPLDISYNKDDVYKLMTKDKKADGSKITIVKVKEAGTCYLEEIDMESCKQYLKG